MVVTCGCWGAEVTAGSAALVLIGEASASLLWDRTIRESVSRIYETSGVIGCVVITGSRRLGRFRAAATTRSRRIGRRERQCLLSERDEHRKTKKCSVRSSKTARSFVAKVTQVGRDKRSRTMLGRAGRVGR